MPAHIRSAATLARRERAMPKLAIARVPVTDSEPVKLPGLPVEILRDGVVVDVVHLPDPRESFCKRYIETQDYIQPLAGFSARPALS